MTAQVTENLVLLAGAPDGIAALRQLILDLAVSGRLVPQISDVEPSVQVAASFPKVKPQSTSDAAVSGANVLPSLPSTWCYVPFNDLVDQQRPIAYRVLVPGPEVTDGVPFVRIADLSICAPKLRPEKSIAPDVDAQFKRSRLQGGEILMGVVGSVGKLGIAPLSWAGANIARAICRIVPAESVSREFVLLILQSDLMRKQFLGNTRTLAQPTLNIGLIRASFAPLPPLAEQRRIVAKVDELMALCDQLETQQQGAEAAHAQLVQALLDSLTQARDADEFHASWQQLAEHFHELITTESSVGALKQAILQCGCSGRLTRRAVGFVEDPPARYLAQAVETPFDVPLGWHWVKFGDLCSLVTSGSRGWKEYYSDRGSTFIRSQDIKADRLEFDQRAFVNLPADAEGSRTQVALHDILITITGANVGKAALLTESLPDAYVSQHVALVRLRSPAYAAYIHRWLINSYGGRRLLLNSSYGAKPGLNLQNIRDLPVPLPPLGEQQDIVAKTDQLMSLCDCLKANICACRLQHSQLAEVLVESALT